MKPFIQKHNYYHHFYQYHQHQHYHFSYFTCRCSSSNSSSSSSSNSSSSVIVSSVVVVVIVGLGVGVIVLFFVFILMVLKGMFELFSFWSLTIIPLWKQELQHLAYRTGYQREWSLCWANKKDILIKLWAQNFNSF